MTTEREWMGIRLNIFMQYANLFEPRPIEDDLRWLYGDAEYEAMERRRLGQEYEPKAEAKK